MYIIKYKQDGKWIEKNVVSSSDLKVSKYCMDLMKKDLGITAIKAYLVIMNKRKEIFSMKGDK